MCVVSMVMQTYFDRYTVPTEFPPYHWPTYQVLMDKARKYDELMKQSDCQDPVKHQWHEELTRFMRERYGLEPK